MKTQFLGLAAGALLSVAAASTALAATAADRWIAEAGAALQARVARAGLADDGKAVAIRIKATADDKRYAPKVARTSGSADFDNAVRESLDGVKLPLPPIELNGRGVTFTLGQPTDGAHAAAD
jgi:hypothetical protein